MVDFSSLRKANEIARNFNPEDYEPENVFREERSLEEIDIATGKEISMIMNSPIPEYLVELERLGTRTDCQHSLFGISPEEKVEILSIYEGSIARPFDLYLNKTVYLLGAIVWYHPPFQPADGSDKKPGYEQILLLTDNFDEDNQPIVIKGSAGLTNHIRGILSAKGWYMWDEPTPYTFKRGGAGMPFQMINTSRVNKMLAAKKAREGKK